MARPSGPCVVGEGPCEGMLSSEQLCALVELPDSGAALSVVLGWQQALQNRQ